MSRNALVWFMASLVSLVPTLTWWLVARSAARGTANIPNAAHWFAPERRAATARYLCRHAAGLAALLSAFLAYNFWLLVRAASRVAQGSPLSMPFFLGGLALFMAVTIGFVVAIHRRLRTQDLPS
jgi:CubicO group peptidase (beta-lactamase class C family)